jgi:lauroyl/myristoyl acyltransferase
MKTIRKLTIIYIRELLRWFYWGPFRIIVRLLPKRMTYSLMNPAGIFLYLINREKGRQIRNWIESLPVKTVGSVLKKEVSNTFVFYCRNSLDSLLYPTMNTHNISDMVEYKGIENLDIALSKGKGAIVLYPHFGNEEFLMPALGYRGYRVNQVASRWEPTYLMGKEYWLANKIKRYAYKMRIRTRERLPVNFVYIDKGVRDIFRLLSMNEIILLSIDGREGKGWVEVKFLGKKALISTGPMKLALLSGGSPVTPAFIIRKHQYRHTLTFLEPFELKVTGDMEKDIAFNTERFLSLLEPFIIQYLSQYAKFILFDVKLFGEEN